MRQRTTVAIELSADNRSQSSSVGTPHKCNAPARAPRQTISDALATQISLAGDAQEVMS